MKVVGQVVLERVGLRGFDITDQKEKEIQLQSENRILEEQSTKDALMGIHNRRAIMEELEKRINQSLNYGSPLCIGMLDIDHFKAINDTKGHVVGDQILQKVAQIISTGIRGLDEVGRYAHTRLYEAKKSGRNRIKIT